VPYSLTAQIAEVTRELEMRPGVYSRIPAMRGSVGEMHIAIMRDVLGTLQWLRENEAFIREAVAARRAEQEGSTNGQAGTEAHPSGDPAA
jgi:hypothetical protein